MFEVSSFVGSEMVGTGKEREWRRETFKIVDSQYPLCCLDGVVLQQYLSSRENRGTVA